MVALDFFCGSEVNLRGSSPEKDTSAYAHSHFSEVLWILSSFRDKLMASTPEAPLHSQKAPDCIETESLRRQVFRIAPQIVLPEDTNMI